MQLDILFVSSVCSRTCILDFLLQLQLKPSTRRLKLASLVGAPLPTRPKDHYHADKYITGTCCRSTSWKLILTIKGFQTPSRSTLINSRSSTNFEIWDFTVESCFLKIVPQSLLTIWLLFSRSQRRPSTWPSPAWVSKSSKYARPRSSGLCKDIFASGE